MKHDLPSELEAGHDAAGTAHNADAAAAPSTSGHPNAAPNTSDAPTASGPNPYAEPAQPRDAHGGAPHGFFAWLRGLGIPRQPGWIGGVAAGIAARIGIDPIVVRGVLVVLAIFAAPVVLFYGVAWLLLPDAEGRIHAQRLAKGEPQPALAGIAVFVLLGLFSPLTTVLETLPVFPFWYNDFAWSASTLIGAYVNILIIAALVFFVVWLVKRNKNSRGGGAESAWPTDASGTTVASGSDGGGVRSGDTDAAASHSTAAAFAAPAAATAPGVATTAATADNEPPAPAAGASTDELAAWKLQHEAWRIERERFNRAQADADRAARQQWAAENKARSQAFAAQAIEHRRLRKLERPRVSASAVFFTLGVALVAGAASAITAVGNPQIADYAATVGVLVAALVASVAMIIAGIARRRSGFLAFVAILLLVVGMASAVLPRNAQFLFPGQDLSSEALNGTYIQPWGDLSVWVVNDAYSTNLSPREATITKANGNITIYLLENTTLELRADLAEGKRVTGARESSDGSVNTLSLSAGSDEDTIRIGNAGAGHAADLTINAELGNGSIHIIQYVD